MQAHTAGAAADSAPPSSEDQLILRAQAAVSACRWTVGECASVWTKKYARGRTDADFAALVDLSSDQVYQRRRVWDEFSDVREHYPSLCWSHFYTALTWDDAPDCLGWAEENKATIAEMKAWRRAVRGEDLSLSPEAIPFPSDAVQFVADEHSLVQDPEGYAAGRGPGRPREAGEPGAEELAGTVAGAARQLQPDGSYAPFRATAGSAPGKESGGTKPAPEAIPPEQMVKRMTATLERCLKVFTPEFRKEFRKLPDPLKQRLVQVVGDLSSTVGNLL